MAQPLINRPVVFLDRDGTLIVEKHYLHDPLQVELLPQTIAGLKKLQNADFRFIVITNQSGIGRGLFTLDAVFEVHNHIDQLLAKHGLKITAYYICPHLPDDGCDCRKPKPMLALRAADEFSINIARSFMIGDKACDIDLGHNMGATTILVKTGYGIEELRQNTCSPHFICDNLDDAAEAIILHHQQQ
jgi:histidinol-phosphate phosphatase family protein